ncbi:hypothetical protein MyChFU_39570 [Mycobacterium intracellulare subsp. chimaera]
MKYEHAEQQRNRNRPSAPDVQKNASGPSMEGNTRGGRGMVAVLSVLTAQLCTRDYKNIISKWAQGSIAEFGGVRRLAIDP